VASGGQDGIVRVNNGANGRMTKTVLSPAAQPKEKSPEKE
jgi:hypothetical protein